MNAQINKDFNHLRNSLYLKVMSTKLFMVLLLSGASISLLGQEKANILKQYYKSQSYANNASGRFLQQSEKEIADSFAPVFPKARDILVIRDYGFMLDKSLFGAIYSMDDSLPMVYHRYDDEKHVAFHQPVPFSDSLFYQKIKDLFLADSLPFYETKNIHARQADDEWDIFLVIHLKKEGKSYNKEIFTFFHPLAFRSEILSHFGL
jgi:hypothetical protein